MVVLSRPGEEAGSHGSQFKPWQTKSSQLQELLEELSGGVLPPRALPHIASPEIETRTTRDRSSAGASRGQRLPHFLFSWFENPRCRFGFNLLRCIFVSGS